MIQYIKRLICKRKGHKWITYTANTSDWYYDIEQAGYCESALYLRKNSGTFRYDHVEP